MHALDDIVIAASPLDERPADSRDEFLIAALGVAVLFGDADD